jgi:NADH-quinone oxidoreductase subunit J
MSLAAAFFYLFSAVLLASAVMVIAARNPVHSVLFLILAFVSASGLFILMGAEFLVMMLDVDFAALKKGILQYMPLAFIIGVIVAIELILVVGGWTAKPGVAPKAAETVSNTHALGRVLYTDYVYFFQAAGLILLTAMIGAIVLTLHHKPGVKRQNIADQNARDRNEAVELKKVPSRTGV